MRVPTNSWSMTPLARKVLFFAQQMREMVTAQTFESFRAMSLDSLDRLDECINVLRDVNEGRIPEISSHIFLEELIWSLENDVAVRNLEPHLVQLIINEKKSIGKKPPSTFSEPAQLLRKKIADRYKFEIERLIVSNIESLGKSSELRKLCGYYCTRLTGTGYSRDFIRDAVEERFFSKPMIRAGSATVKAFFQKFNGATHKYRVFVQTDIKFANSMRQLGYNRYTHASLPSHVSSVLTGPFGPSVRWVELTASGEDEYKAADFSEFFLNWVESINQLGPQIAGHRWRKVRAVYRERTSRTKLVTPPSSQKLEHRPLSVKRVGASRLENTMELVFSNFAKSSTTRVLQSLNSSDLTGKNATPATRLLSLWSAVEILLSDPPRGTARIVHYEERLVPCVIMRHSRRNVAAIFDELFMIYRYSLSAIIKKESDFSSYDLHTRFAAVMSLPKNKPLRDQLLTLCADNPLALYRLYKLNKELSSPSAMIKAYDDHAKRVRWQIYRIYRLRNTIVHAGKSSRNLSSLTGNLLEYYKAALWSIITHVRLETDRSNLKRAVEEIGVEQALYRAKLSGYADQPTFTTESLKCAFHVI